MGNSSDVLSSAARFTDIPHTQRHAREGGHPRHVSVSAPRSSLRHRTWIPAFAGMTSRGGCGVLIDQTVPVDGAMLTGTSRSMTNAGEYR